MIIQTKHEGYQAGIRLYPFGGGGGGGGGDGGGDGVNPPRPPPPPRLPSAAPAPTFQTYGSGDRTGSLVQSGNSFRPSTLDYSKPIYDPNYADNITGYKESSQFYQPIQQQQYQNYNMGNPFNVSQYGQQPSYRTYDDGGFMPQMQTPFNPYTNQYQAPFSYQQPPQYQQQQMQTPFSYQQPQYQPQQMQQPVARPNYGPSQAIVGRSSQMRGTPNVMRRAEGGITSLMDND